MVDSIHRRVAARERQTVGADVDGHDVAAFVCELDGVAAGASEGVDQERARAAPGLLDRSIA